MPEITDIFENGFYMNSQHRRLNDLAALSLKIAMKSFFSTYQSMKYSLHIFSNGDYDKDTISRAHSEDYFEYSSETIIHFHHFFELVCKEILRTQDIIYPKDNFKKSFDRLYESIEQNAGSVMLDFFVSSKELLTQLNILRNKLLHRGVFILSYPALDRLVGKYIFPLVKQILNLPHFGQIMYVWKYKPLSCNVDPIDEIEKDFITNEYDITKIALLKELGRSAYANQITPNSKSVIKFIDDEKIRRYEKMVGTLIGSHNVSQFTKCPVCGLKTLIVYDDIEMDDYNENTSSYSKAWRYTWQVECICCTFETNYHLKNPREYNIPIDDFWIQLELK